jgi:hypothetical protein
VVAVVEQAALSFLLVLRLAVEMVEAVEVAVTSAVAVAVTAEAHLLVPMKVTEVQ